MFANLYSFSSKYNLIFETRLTPSASYISWLIPDLEGAKSYSITSNKHELQLESVLQGTNSALYSCNLLLAVLYLL